MLNVLETATEGLRRELKQFDPARVTSSQAATIFELAAELGRLAESVKLLAAPRAADSRRWAAEGHRSAASWVAQKSKSSFGDALSTLETARRMLELPATTEAVKNGQLSRFQAKEVAEAASARPRAEADLLRVAAHGNMKRLKDRAREVLAQSSSSEGETAKYRLLHKHRFFRHWTDRDGAVHLDARLTPESGGRVVAAVSAKADEFFKRAREHGVHEASGAYQADALEDLVTRGCTTGRAAGSNGSSRPRADTVVVKVDAAALRRGFVKDAEVCEVAGVGPVPVATARKLLGDAFVKILVKEGVDVASVCHVGRTVPAHLQSALEERDPSCVIPGCEVSRGLENHHWKQDYAESRTTSLAALGRVCARHHDMISYQGYKLAGGPGKWKLIPPRGAPTA